MARDPFAGYDSWLERPYQDAYERDDAEARWAEDHTHYTMTCCGAELDDVALDFNADGTPCARRCTNPECIAAGDGVAQFADVAMTVDEPPDPSDDYDERDDEPDDDPRNDYLNLGGR